MTKRKSKGMPAGPGLFGEMPITFGARFLQRHAGHIMDDPAIALVELVANCYDAGSTEVYIRWPEDNGGVPTM